MYEVTLRGFQQNRPRVPVNPEKTWFFHTGGLALAAFSFRGSGRWVLSEFSNVPGSRRCIAPLRHASLRSSAQRWSCRRGRRQRLQR